MSPLASADIVKPAGQAPAGPGAAHVIVVGNEKGGAGKSTVAIHLAIALMRMGKAVGVIDLDVRQASLSRHLDNRRTWSEKRGLKLPTPAEARLPISEERSLDAREAEEKAAWEAALASLKESCDYIVIDAPGGDTHYARLAHAAADTLITPINDSFVDFALLADVDPDTYEVGRPSIYAEMVWECRKRKAMTDRRSMDWVVMRNRVSTLDAKNKRRVGKGLKALSERIGFRLAPGFSERVIYRELFPKGLTLIDLTESGSTAGFTMSHVAARQELRELLIVLKLPGLEGARIPF
ncbi:MAG: division plane positioning ATPase MipZ [Oceanicaulis sp.]